MEVIMTMPVILVMMNFRFEKENICRSKMKKKMNYFYEENFYGEKKGKEKLFIRCRKILSRTST